MLVIRGDNPAAAASEASVDRGAEAKSNSTRNPIDLARPKTPRHHENHEQREFRRELGVIHYKFDKKEQVRHTSLCSVSKCRTSSAPPPANNIVTSMILLVFDNFRIFKPSEIQQPGTSVKGRVALE